jgi:hypothetical protein
MMPVSPLTLFRPLLKIVFALEVILFPFGFSAHAGVYEERVANTEVIYLGSARVDFEVRKHLTQNASEIDLVSPSQTADEVGLNFLVEVRRAQEKGTKVRGIYDRISSAIEGDPFNTVSLIIADPRVKCPAEVLCGYPLDRLKVGLGANDFIHEKITRFVERGTNREFVIIGGRGYTQLAEKSFDSAFLIRAIDTSRPYLGTDLKDAYDHLFQTMKAMANPEKPKMNVFQRVLLNQKMGELKTTPRLTPSENIAFQKIIRILEQPASLVGPLAPFQFHPKSAQLFTNDLFSLLPEQRRTGVFTNRVALPNDILSKLIEDIDQFEGEIDFTGYSIALPEKLRDAVIRFVKRSERNTVIFRTNGKKAHALFGLPIYYSVEELVKITQETQDAPGKVKVFFLEPELAKRAGLSTFVHRKLITLVGRNIGEQTIEKRTYTGSVNPTWSSHHKNNELMAMFVDARLTEYLDLETKLEMPAYRLVTTEELEEMRRKTPLVYWCIKPLIKATY